MLAGEAYNNVPEDSAERAALRARHLDRVRSFLRFEIKPGPDNAVGYVIIAGASPLIDSARYAARIEKGVELAAKYPDSKLIFSGNMPHESRRTGTETTSEADMMLTDAGKLGFDVRRGIVEPNSNNLKENFELSVSKIADQIRESQTVTEVVVVSSQSTLRRAYYGAAQVLEEQFPDIKDKIKLCFVSSDDDLSDEGLVFYEMRRLSEYRSKGWL
jgi:uncharacterized protein YlxP (DUF503 family)